MLHYISRERSFHNKREGAIRGITSTNKGDINNLNYDNFHLYRKRQQLVIAKFTNRKYYGLDIDDTFIKLAKEHPSIVFLNVKHY
jgi:hypothetical protein